MSSANVQTIFDQIEQLPIADRHVLERRLAELAEQEWKREVEAARQGAQERSID